MKCDLWIHQFDTAYDGNLVGLSPDDSQLPIACVFIKAMDGFDYMASFDKHPKAIHNVVDMLAHRDEYAAQGIDVRPWVVPHGDDQAFAEGQLHGEFAAALGRALIVDVEPYAGFWRGNEAAVTAYLAGVKAAGCDEVWLSADPRGGKLEPIHYATWYASPMVTRYIPQCYWTDFQRPSLNVIQEAWAETLTAGKWQPKNFSPALPGDASPDVMRDALAYCEEQGYGVVSIWQRMTLRADTAAAIGKFGEAGDWGLSVPSEPVALTPSPAPAGVTENPMAYVEAMQLITSGMNQVQNGAAKIGQLYLDTLHKNGGA